ncbi:MAG TPA: HIT domain-containing protein [Acidimicrobiia bacterium]|nr:HIT domain-containing protein [Acidimicrobiia bacterium]
MTLDRLWAGWRSEYIEGVAGSEPRAGECLFCTLAAAEDDEDMVLARNEHAFAVMNAYPYTSGHLMVAPVRHEGTLAGLTRDEANALMALTQDATSALAAAYRPEGMNVGVNIGRAAGAGIPGHVHVHALPRWNGDTNFMTAVAEARVLPESLSASYEKLRAAWPAPS